MTKRRDRPRRRSWKHRAAALLVFLLSSTLQGESEQKNAVTAKEEESEFESLLKQETELATKTRMNQDYVPGMVTVLHGDDLEAQGVRNVWEALSLVPGVQTARDLYSSPLVLVRGINFIFNSGNIKILVDSVGINHESAGINSSILLMPIEEVQRIEFMRGPGSVVHGDFAYLGLVNIITRREGRRAFAAVETDRASAGGHYSIPGAPAGHRFSLGLSGIVGSDVDGQGPARSDEKKGFGRLSWGYGGFSLNIQALGSEHRVTGNEEGERFRERRVAIEARYGRDLSPGLHAEAYAGYLRSNDEVGAKGHDGRTLQAGLDLKWNVPGRHELLLALGFTRSDLSSGSLVLPPLFDLTVHDISRHWTSVAIQDQWGISRSLTLTAGVRLDDFSDVGSRITPRFALVYQLDDHQILKSQYAEGFRTPAFFELYSTGSALPGLEPESIATTELSYILRQSRFVGRLTLFYSKLTNMIQPPSFPGGNFGNSASATTKGVEAEWSQELSRAAKISMNVSWADPHDERGTGDVLAASEWMWNLTLLTEPLAGWQLAGRWNHTGTRGGFAGTRTTDGYDTVDLTVSALKLVSGLTLRGGVKNLLDDPVTYITTLPPPIDPITQLYGGRSYWAQISFRF